MAVGGMGTKLHGNDNAFTALLNNNHHVVTIDPNTSGNWERFNNIPHKEGHQTAFNCSQELSMDTFQNNRESIRKILLRQEEIFRQQVQDLHRLYSVQKMLMAEIRNKQEKLQSPTIATSIGFADTKTRFCSSTSTSDPSHSSHVCSTHHSTAHLNSEYSSLHHYQTRAGPSSRKLSIYSEDPLRAQEDFNLGQPAEDYTFTEVRHTQDQPTNLGKYLKEKIKAEGSDLWTEDESDVELTLSIGCGPDKRRSKHWRSLNNQISFSNSTPSDIRPLLLSTTSRPGRVEECSDHSTGLDRKACRHPPGFSKFWI